MTPRIAISPAFIGGCGLKPRTHLDQPLVKQDFARLYWRVRIETAEPRRTRRFSGISPAFIGGCGLKLLDTTAYGCRTAISPAFIGGCGLKPFPTAQEAVFRHFARLYWRVRIETPPTYIKSIAVRFRPPLLAGAD